MADSDAAGGRAAQTAPMLVFDGDCGFCTTTAMFWQRRLDRHDGRDPMVVPWQRTDLAALGLSSERTQREIVWVEPGGATRGGAQAFAAWLAYRPGSWRLVGRVLTLPGLRHVAAAGYRLIARNRRRLPGGTPMCALPTPPQRQP